MRDEQEIRDLFNNWIKSTTEGNLELARQCIADDAVFFVPGFGEMNKESFAQAAAGGSPEESPIDFDLNSKLRELKVFGDQAYLWIESTLVCSPKNGDPATLMAGRFRNRCFRMCDITKRSSTFRQQTGSTGRSSAAPLNSDVLLQEKNSGRIH
jgi:ketosteroid isomerase-like protein